MTLNSARDAWHRITCQVRQHTRALCQKAMLRAQHGSCEECGARMATHGFKRSGRPRWCHVCSAQHEHTVLLVPPAGASAQAGQMRSRKTLVPVRRPPPARKAPPKRAPLIVSGRGDVTQWTQSPLKGGPGTMHRGRSQTTLNIPGPPQRQRKPQHHQRPRMRRHRVAGHSHRQSMLGLALQVSRPM